MTDPTFPTIDLAALDTVTGGDGDDASAGAAPQPLQQTTGGHDSMTFGGYAKACAAGAVRGGIVGGIGGGLVSGGAGVVPGAAGGALYGCGRALATHTLFGTTPAY
ncbi:MAG TPA: hypothetical protein VMJ10_28455 [Kofleriaceae bacterium]|nr:hypothetical protein [Kofleriaceae bacterium]